MSINPRFHNRVKQVGIKCEHVAEVGVSRPETSNIHGFIMDGIRATLVEPEPTSMALIREYFGDRGNVELHACAVCDFEGEVELFYRGSSTFLASLESSPAIVNDRFEKENQKAFRAQCVRFSAIDDGTIDVLSVDTEGSEWFVLKHMTSRPAIVSVETHGGAYRNPFHREIRTWMKNEGYALWYKDGSDSVYVRRDQIPVDAMDRIRVFFMNGKIALGALAKRIKNGIRGRPR